MTISTEIASSIVEARPAVIVTPAFSRLTKTDKGNRKTEGWEELSAHKYMRARI